MATFLSIFNNKGGVGKTSYMFHVSHLLARRGRKVLMVDCDSQCNLTAYCLNDDEIRKAWDVSGNSIFRVIEPVYEGIGDFKKSLPLQIESNLYLIPGDLNLSLYEDRLGDTWNSAKGGSKPDIRIQTAIYRYINWGIESLGIDIVVVDLGPNLGALNRATLGGSDYFITPLAADSFSLQGTENLGNKLLTWAREWKQINTSFRDNDLLIPGGKPRFLGYIVQRHNIRNNTSGMTRGWQIFGNQIKPAVMTSIVNKLMLLNQVEKRRDYNLSQIPNFHSLIPYSLNARKPVFDCSHREGRTGEHISSARDSVEYFVEIVKIIDSAMKKSVTHLN